MNDRMRPLLSLCALLLCACTPRTPPAPACRPWEESARSTEPPTHCLFFPSGLAIDPTGDLLYVTNSNGDLSFAGGTLVAVDAERHERAVAAYRRDGHAGCGDRLGWEVSIDEVERRETGRQATDPARDRCYCREDVLDTSIINCDGDRFVLRGQTVKTGNFSGSVRLVEAGDRERRLYLPVRGDPSLTYVRVQRGADRMLDCGGGRGERDHISLCDDSHRVQRSPDTVLADPADPESERVPRLTLPPEPFGVAVDRGPGYEHAVVSHFSGDELSAFDVGAGRPVLTDVRSGLFRTGTIQRGIIAAVPRRPGDPSEPWYAVSRLTGQIALFTLQGPGDTPPPRLGPVESFSITAVFAGTGQDVRDLAFDVDGDRAFVLVHRPPTLLVLDTSRDPVTRRLRNQPIGTVDLPAGPARMVVRREEVRPGIFATRLYITCYDAWQVAVVDPDTRRLEQVLQVGRGPVSLAIGGAAGQRRRAYVTTYLDNSISVIDLQLGRVVSRSGAPAPKQAQ
jgi:hypothetical protein